MARKNRRMESPGYASTVTSAVLVCFAVAVALLGHIRLKGELNRLDSEISRLDRRLAELRRGNNKLEMDYEVLVSPAGLSSRLREMRLNLVMPGDNARIVLPEPEVEPSLPGMPGHETRHGRFAVHDVRPRQP